MSASNRVVSIVDDDPSVRRSLSRLLRASNYHVETFASALEFLDRGQLESGCLLLDIRMPDVSGFHLQRLLGDARHGVRIVFMTGHGDEVMAARARHAGARAFLTKPFDEETVLEAIRHALDDRPELTPSP
jgi:two-component system response regulator FixJ